MIVDDSTFNLIPLELILTNLLGFRVVKAFNGQQAVETYKENIEKSCCNKKIRLVFMDLNMPIMDGYEATVNILELNRLTREAEFTQN